MNGNRFTIGQKRMAHFSFTQSAMMARTMVVIQRPQWKTPALWKAATPSGP